MLLEIALVLIGTVCIMVPVWIKRWKFDVSKLSVKVYPMMMMKMKRFKRDGYYEEREIEEAYARLCDVTLPPAQSHTGGDLSKIRAYQKEKSDLLSKIKDDKHERLEVYYDSFLEAKEGLSNKSYTVELSTEDGKAIPGEYNMVMLTKEEADRLCQEADVCEHNNTITSECSDCNEQELEEVNYDTN